MAIERTEQRKAISGELEAAKYAVQKESQSVIKALDATKEKERALKEWINCLEKHARQPVKEVVEKAEKYEKIETKINQLRLQNPAKAIEIESLFQDKDKEIEHVR